MLIKIYSDAATRGNPGPSGAGLIIIHDGIQIQKHHYLGIYTNHESEFLAAIWAFQEVASIASSQDTIMFYTDSRLVSDSIGKNYTHHYPNLLNQLNDLITTYHIVLTNWIPDKQNMGAHRLALQALPKRG